MFSGVFLCHFESICFHIKHQISKKLHTNCTRKMYHSFIYKKLRRCNFCFLLNSDLVDIHSEIITNLLKPTLETTTQNGVTCTNNGDGIYILNGMATDQTTFSLSVFKLKVGNYKLTGNPSEVFNEYFIGLLDTINGWQIGGLCYDKNGTMVNNIKEQDCTLVIRIPSGKVCDNLVFKPMLTTNLNATYDDFVPYTGSTGSINGDVAELNSDLANKGKYYELGNFYSTGSKALLDNALNYEELAVYGNVLNDGTNYVIDTMRIQSASIKISQYFIVALNDGTNRKGQFIFSTNGDNIIVDKLDNVSSLTVYGITKKS